MKPIIEDVIISQEKLQELNLEVYRKVTRSKPLIIRTYYGGPCTYCGEIPTKKVSYDIRDAQLVEFYCDLCYQKHKNELDKILQNINFS